MNRYLVIGHLEDGELEHDYISAYTPEHAEEYFISQLVIREMYNGVSKPEVYVDYVISGDNIEVVN